MRVVHDKLIINKCWRGSTLKVWKRRKGGGGGLGKSLYEILTHGHISHVCIYTHKLASPEYEMWPPRGVS